ncbi:MULTISPECIES: hypothetical protein [unclassified Fusibacter]|uniref:hypothetical protein n=1 Tax=unclassified Fusibacter TaxID=2624464 RepID=UPI001012A62D|nr:MULTISPECIES: hypothetical protein [unclassified Fusibacter]MCK8060293.1 hypothetical protein [Fusibacter sp. A2]NPE20418.1 hypothetical protein [Fusibacter sp. A1]RXV63623.1 hypothetical protein DWB64_01205 [Fusibacter sp. A1]
MKNCLRMIKYFATGKVDYTMDQELIFEHYGNTIKGSLVGIHRADKKYYLRVLHEISFSYHKNDKWMANGAFDETTVRDNLLMGLSPPPTRFKLSPESVKLLGIESDIITCKNYGYQTDQFKSVVKSSDSALLKRHKVSELKLVELEIKDDLHLKVNETRLLKPSLQQKVHYKNLVLEKPILIPIKINETVEPMIYTFDHQAFRSGIKFVIHHCYTYDIYNESYDKDDLIGKGVDPLMVDQWINERRKHIQNEFNSNELLVMIDCESTRGTSICMGVHESLDQVQSKKQSSMLIWGKSHQAPVCKNSARSHQWIGVIEKEDKSDLLLEILGAHVHESAKQNDW